MEPILKYPGGKYRELGQFLRYIPKFTDETEYIEPFIGGGALYFHLCPSKATISDLNKPLINFYKCCQENPKYMINALQVESDSYKQLTLEQRCIMYYAYARRAMFNAGEINDTPNYPLAIAYYTINHLAYSGLMRYNKKGEYNVPFGKYQSFPNRLTIAHTKLLMSSTIVNCDYKKIFHSNGMVEDAFMFLDPPYDSTFSSYDQVVFGLKDHKELAEEFKKLKCKALMIIGKTPLIEELYKGYIIGEYNKNYSINLKNRVKESAMHLIITNYGDITK